MAYLYVTQASNNSQLRCHFYSEVGKTAAEFESSEMMTTRVLLDRISRTCIETRATAYNLLKHDPGNPVPQCMGPECIDDAEGLIEFCRQQELVVDG